MISPEFESGGCRWCVVLHPNVDNCISMSLLVSGCEDLPPGWKINAKFLLSIKCGYERSTLDSVARYFDSEGPSWGLSNWFHRSQLDGFLDPRGDLKVDARVEVLHKSDPMFTFVIKESSLC
ncbi:unnamed protein product [Microthlaspi erraticum]|uniref:MATH domain-containing protein n=1 Tax=Microthlaspi erraticum TaxID=1685480 RepID=A0A6D2J5F4_9BRAS|nr:unnamed protein product [Microthlaspi erraticum]